MILVHKQTAVILPGPALIFRQAKTAEMICLSFKDLRGGMILNACDKGTPDYRRER
jgi:hypothetical protein